MGDLLKIAVATALINNVVLSQFLGLCPFLGVSKKSKTAAGMGGAVLFVMTFTFSKNVLTRPKGRREGAPRYWCRRRYPRVR